MTLSAIAETAGLQPATSHRLVNSLCEVGFLERHNGQKVYVLGSRMIQLSLLAVTQPRLSTQPARCCANSCGRMARPHI